MEQLIKKLKKANQLNQLVLNYSLMVDDKNITHGCIFTIPLEDKKLKIFIPSPNYEDLITNTKKLTVKEVVSHSEAMYLT